MGIFDFLKKKKSEKGISETIDENSYVLETLKNKLASLGYTVERNKEYPALSIHSELEIATVIINNPNNHPSLIQIMVMAIHPIYFPNGIEENVVGIGATIKEKADTALENYLNTTFSPIIESFSENHIPEIDFMTKTVSGEVLWHPNLGDLTFQGKWKEYPDGEPLFEILKEGIKTKLYNQKFNWLKIYISKNADEEIIGECLFNNEPWEEGLSIISDYAKGWNQENELFLAQKQFIMFRRCDKYDI